MTLVMQVRLSRYLRLYDSASKPPTGPAPAPVLTKVRKSWGMSALAISKHMLRSSITNELNETDQKRQPKEVLSDLVVSCGAMTALLITRDGHLMSEGGETGYLDTTAMAALVAGMFSATREVARIVGEQQFSILLQQGEKRHIHISLVLGSAMLIVVFEDYQRIGLVRHQARKAGLTLAELLRKETEMTKPELAPELSMPAFKEYALDLIDRIFKPN